MDATTAAETLRATLQHVRGRSPMYERLVAGLAGAAERGFDGGVIGRLLQTPGPSSANEARLLILAALQHAALQDPSLPHAAWYPYVTGADARPPDDGAPAALALAYLVEHEEDVAGFLRTHRLQTNEIGRCAAMLPGFLHAAGFGQPLRLLELGPSAGLNLRFDRYRYEYAGGPAWGPTGGPLLTSRAEGRVPRSLAPPTVEVAERRGADLHPIEVTDDDAVRLLHSFVWADEIERHEHLDEAIRVARATPARLDQGDLVAWAREQATPAQGTTTVLFHSQVRHLLDRDQSSQLQEVAETALRAATPAAPVVYVAFEAPLGVTADHWPELLVGSADGSGPPRWSTPVTADWHGRWVRWF